MIKSNVIPFKRTPKQAEATKVLVEFPYSLLVGGSRSGKTFLTVRSIVIRALTAKSRHLIVRLRFNHVKTSIWYDTFPKVMKLCFPDMPFKENRSDWFVRFPNGSEIWFAGIDSKERAEKVLGNEYSTIYINEGSQIEYNSVLILLTRLAEKTALKNKLYIDCNPPTKKHWTYKLFYEFIDPLTSEPKNKRLYGSILMNPTDNKENLPDGYITDILASLPKRQRDRFLHGIYVNDVDGAIWSLDTLNQCVAEYSTYEELKSNVGIRSIGIGVDPSTKNNKDSDLCGIVVVAIGNDDLHYVIRDVSLKATPDVWANKVIEMYDYYDANFIIVETNQGGDMVETILKSKDFYGKIIEVHASKSKFARAEPVEAMYEQGKVKHLNCEGLRYLEDEMTTWVPSDSKKSPDRLDALVWVMSHYIGKGDIVAKYGKLFGSQVAGSLRR